MGVYIKGMDMPKNCFQCSFNDGIYCCLNDTEALILKRPTDRLKDCPLIEIVECKDCEYADEYYHCKYTEWWNGNSDFCSHGIPRKEKR